MFLSSLMAIAAVLIMGVISPGPSFIFVAAQCRRSLASAGMVTAALGTGAGAAIFSIHYGDAGACRRCSPRCRSCLLV